MKLSTIFPKICHKEMLSVLTRALVFVAAFLFMFLPYIPVHAAFTPIIYPGTSINIAYGVNNSGIVVGETTNHSGHYGFVWDGASYSTLNVPGDYTVARGINNNGVIVGSSNRTGAFIFDSNGYHSFSYPGTPTDINDSGNIVGMYVEEQHFRGFLLDGNGFHTLNYPGAKNTYACGINNLNQIVGIYRLSDNVNRAFVFDGMNYTSLTIPERLSKNMPKGYSMDAFGINDSGKIVGTISNYDGTYLQGWLIDGNSFSILEIPGSGLTSVNDINNDNQVVGHFSGHPDYHAAGFIADYQDIIGHRRSFVPIPPTILLLSPCLIGLAGLSRKFQK